MITVAKDGSGNYTSIQAAVDAAPEGAEIRIRAGEYRERVTVHKNGLRLTGEDPEKTVLTFDACAMDRDETGAEKGTFRSFTLLVTGRDVTVEDLTIRNDAGDGRVVGQAVAVYAAGDRGVWRNCRLIAHQDTLFCGPLMEKVVRESGDRGGSAECVESVGDCPLTRSRQLFVNCWIQGDVDFIFGSYRCWFEGCTLYMNERGGYYTAANTPEGQPHGLVFRCCRLSGACPEGDAYLGRPWRAFARTVFLDCEMDEHVAPEGFADWDAARLVTERCGEAGTTGARADLTTRHPSEKRLSPEEAAALTPAAVLGGEDGWNPLGTV